MTTLWISPVFKQVESDRHSYHGYGIQNFLDIDPHFGARQELIDLVNTAHDHGILVILDIILNHAGDVFGYRLQPGALSATDERAMPIWIRAGTTRPIGGGLAQRLWSGQHPFANIDPDTPRLRLAQRCGMAGGLRDRPPSPPEAASTAGITIRSSTRATLSP